MMYLSDSSNNKTESMEPVLPPQITCTIHHSFDEIKNLQQEWDAFIEAVGGDIYLTFDWCRVWWQYYGKGRKLIICIYRDSQRIVAILPLFIEMVWLGPVWLKIAKMVGSDHTMAMLDPPVQAEFAEAVFQDALISLVSQFRCDALWLGPLSGMPSACLDALRSICGQADSSVRLLREKVRSSYTEFNLPKSFEEYLNLLSKQWRDNYRRYDKTLCQKYSVRLYIIHEIKDIGLIFDDFCEKHEMLWHLEGKQGHFNDWPSGYGFNREQIIEQSKSRRSCFVCIKADDRIVSYFMCYRFRDVLYARLSARSIGPMWDRYGLGRLGLIKMIEWAIGQGIRRIEAGAGHYDYKIKTGGQEHPLITILIAQNRWCSRLRVCIFHVFSEWLHFFYYRIWFNRIAAKLPFKRLPLWKLWIRTRL